MREYLRGARQRFDLPLDLRGTPFQLSVWHAVAGIPYGTLRTYGELAREIGHVSATRAVGQAVGANPTALIVPCHRVVGASGSLVGYAGGLPLKERLLALERGSLSL
jgi:O-6-methylguanine DNA methyltransferase